MVLDHHRSQDCGKDLQAEEEEEVCLSRVWRELRISSHCTTIAFMHEIVAFSPKQEIKRKEEKGVQVLVHMYVIHASTCIGSEHQPRTLGCLDQPVRCLLWDMAVRGGWTR